MRARNARGLKLGWAGPERWPVVGRLGPNLPPERDPPKPVTVEAAIRNKAGLRAQTAELIAAYHARQPAPHEAKSRQFANAASARSYGLNAYFETLRK